jgi:hypothetical protein
VAHGGGSALGKFLYVRVEGRADGRVVAGRDCAVRHLGNLPRPRRADLVAAPEPLQQGVRGRVRLAAGACSNDAKVNCVTPLLEGRSKHSTQKFEPLP